ncbi:MAG: hypothetical protein C0501_10555 [Isosphaera sp.]|nr:hypothetical protein [Isosphaera sp.]
MPPPNRPPGSSPARPSGPVPYPNAALSFDGIKARVLAKLEDRMDAGASKRMPPSLLRQTLRGAAEGFADQDGRGLSRADRDRLVEEVLAELLGYGPLGELFADPAVREVMVAGPQVVIARREMGAWTPTPVRFRDEEHLRTAMDRLATHADPVGGVTTSVNLFDLRLPNGFRAVGVAPPPALGLPPMVGFIRAEPAADLAGPASGRHPVPAAAAGPGSPTASPRPGAAPAGPADGLTRHRNRVMERLASRLASLGVYDLRRLEVGERRRVVAAYVAEYVAAENLYLSDADQGRLILEVLTAMER